MPTLFHSNLQGSTASSTGTVGSSSVAATASDDTAIGDANRGVVVAVHRKMVGEVSIFHGLHSSKCPDALLVNLSCPDALLVNLSNILRTLRGILAKDVYGVYISVTSLWRASYHILY